LNNHIFQYSKVVYGIISYDSALMEISFVFINPFSRNALKKKKEANVNT